MDAFLKRCRKLKDKAESTVNLSLNVGEMASRMVEARNGYRSLRCGHWKRTRITCFLAGQEAADSVSPPGSGEY